MNSNMIGARIAIVGTSIAARRRTASLCICSRRASRTSSLNAKSARPRSAPRSELAAKQVVRPRRARLRRVLGRAPERVDLAHAVTDRAEQRAELLDDDASPAVDDALHGLDRARSGAHVHREQMVDRVELLSDPRRALRHGVFEPLARTRRSDGVARDRSDQHRERRVRQHRDTQPGDRRDDGTLPDLARAELVRRRFVDARLPQQPRQALVAPAVCASEVRQDRAQRWTEQPADDPVRRRPHRVTG